MKNIFLILFLFPVIALNAAQPKQVLFLSPESSGFKSEEFAKPVISPDGTKIIFTTKDFSKIFLTTVPAKSSPKPDKPEIIIESTNCGLNARWLNNEKIIFLASEEGKNNLIFHTICLYNILEKKTSKLTAPSLEKNNPVICGNMILIPNSWGDSSAHSSHLSAKDETDKFLNEIFPVGLSSADEKKSKPFSMIKIENDSVAVNPDELPEFIYFIDNLKLYRMKTGSGETGEIDDRVYSHAISPDNKNIAYCKNNNILIYNIESSSIVDIGEGTLPDWTDEKNIIYVITKDNGHEITSSEVFSANIDSKNKPVNISASVNELEYYPSYDKNAGRIYFSSMKNNSIKYFEYKKK